jgi:sporulation protein YabP
MGNEQGKHAVLLHDRRDMRIEGAIEVVSFDETYVMLKTQCGDMAIEGKDLKIAVLEIDAGIVVLSGTVSGVYYSDPQNKEKRSFVKKLFS